MAAKIEVYVRNEVGILSQGIQRPVADHWCSDAPIGREERVMPEKDRAVVAVAEEFANENYKPSFQETSGAIHILITFMSEMPGILQGWM